MISLETFNALKNQPVGEFAPKPTSLTGQTEAATDLWISEDGATEIGVWECTEGRFTADRSAGAEYCHILSGRARVTNADGSGSREIGPGDLLILPKGWKGEWEIIEHVRKLFVINTQ